MASRPGCRPACRSAGTSASGARMDRRISVVYAQLLIDGAGGAGYICGAPALGWLVGCGSGLVLAADDRC